MNVRHTATTTMLVTAISLTGCSEGVVDAAPGAPAAVSEPIVGTELSRITLTQEAVDRLAIATADVIEVGSQLGIPYGAILYDSAGAAWAYTNPEPLVYVRAAIAVDHIADDLVLLSAGPPPGTAVVTIGAAELYGVESGIGGGH